MKIAGSASMPVNSSAPTHTRVASVQIGTRESSASTIATPNRPKITRILRDSAAATDQRQQPNHLDARVEPLKQAVGFRQLLGVQRALHRSSQPADRPLDEADPPFAAPRRRRSKLLFCCCHWLDSPRAWMRCRIGLAPAAQQARDPANRKERQGNQARAKHRRDDAADRAGVLHLQSVDGVPFVRHDANAEILSSREEPSSPSGTPDMLGRPPVNCTGGPAVSAPTLPSKQDVARRSGCRRRSNRQPP